jgi:hypothetical protein
MTVGRACGDDGVTASTVADDRLLTGPTAALRRLEREGLVVRVVEPPFHLGPQPCWRLTAAGLARSLALLQETAVRVVLPAGNDLDAIAPARETGSDHGVRLPQTMTT